MSGSEPAQPARSSWRWSRSGETQKVLLDAAFEVFLEHGYAGASIAEVVERAGSSVGSLYHHFGDKSGLYRALWEAWMYAQEKNASKAITAAHESGETRASALFAAGARGYLEGAWRTRARGGLFFEKDSPPGFDAMRRSHLDWVRHNTLLLDTPDAPIGRVAVVVVTTMIGEASREVMSSRNKAEAYAIIDAALLMINRLDLENLTAAPPSD